MNILVTRHDKIGDFITVLPLLKILKTNTSHKILVLVSKVNYELACSIEYIDEVILYDNNAFTLIKNIRDKKIDTSISCFIDTRLGLILALSSIKNRISPATKLAQIFFNNSIKQRRGQVKKTEWEYNIDLLKEFSADIDCTVQRPLLSFQASTPASNEKIIAFHPGFGGSSEGNLKLDDYLHLAQSISELAGIKIIFTFGPDDGESKKYIKANINFPAEIIDSQMSLVDFCKLLASVDTLVSTSTGPMHLAGALNIKTLSFFGDSLFASSKRWATISDRKKQTNIEVPIDYDKAFYQSVENKLSKIIMAL